MIRASAVFLLAVSANAQSTEFFEKNVRPVLVTKCAGCHGGAAPAANLALDSREALLKGGARGAAVVPGNAGGSLLLRVVRHADGVPKMPPGPKLSDAEIAALAHWVDTGAGWSAASASSAKPANGKFWSFVKPEDPAAPAVRDRAWVRNPVDAFVLAALEGKGLKPAAAADKRTLIRRATFDLTGLPPSPGEVRAFLADDSPQAFAKVVDRLLASPRYGERWGRHWLDVARYADSNGLDENLVYKNAFRYRDYVIAAFNSDKPYNTFVQEQIAGDLMASNDLPTQFERWTATGFLSLGAKMLAEDDPVKMQMDIIDEQVDTISRTFMGMTVGCARCHDHKFDPIPAADYYALAGIFKSTHTMDHHKVVAKWHEHVLAPKEERDKLAAHEAAIEAKKKEAGQISKAENGRLRDAAVRQAGAYLLAAHELMEAGKIRLKPRGAAALVVREAASFDAGNVPKALEKKKANTVAGTKGPHYAEYRVEAPRAGLYQVDILEQETGSGTPDLHINGELVARGLSAVENRVASPDAGGWSVLGVFDLKTGTNVLRFEHKSRFAYFEKLALAPAALPAGAPVPRTAAWIAQARGVNASYLAQMVDHLERSNGAAASELYAFESFGRPLAEWQSPVAKLFAGGAMASREAVAARYGELCVQALDQDAAAKDAGLGALRAFLLEKFGPFRAPADARDYYPEAARAELARIEKEEKALVESTPEYPHAMGVRDAEKIAGIPVHIRGSHWTLGKEVVPRGFLSALSEGPAPVLSSATSGRLELAQWMTQPEHPLTSRVMVNRLWRWHFGKGIVPSTDNFGRLGEKPTNQPLLDYLAHRFVESGWSVKAMHRLMMLSNTYQMSTAYDERSFETDPENTLLWRANRRRLEGEAIRDAIMQVSGDLDTQHAGGSILTYKDRQYVANTSKRGGVDYDRNIRAVFVPVVRSSMYEVFTAFDMPDPAVPVGDREASVVAPQALFMMNSVVMLRHSKKMAERLLAVPGDDAARVREAYELALSRPASGREIDLALSFLGRLAPKQSDRVMVWQSFCKALLSSSEFIYLN